MTSEKENALDKSLLSCCTDKIHVDIAVEVKCVLVRNIGQLLGIGL